MRNFLTLPSAVAAIKNADKYKLARFYQSKLLHSSRPRRNGLGLVAQRSLSSSMKGKTVVISGASSGIGESLAKLYAKEGATLFLCARRIDKLSAVQEECIRIGNDSNNKNNSNEMNSSVTVLPLDVTEENACKQLISEVITRAGGIDVLVLNAGVGQTFFLESMNADVDYHQFMNVNYYGCVYLTLAALPHMNKTGGRIAVVSSLGGLIPYPRQTFYNASKFALMGFYESLRMEINAKKKTSGNECVSITMVCPGFIKTELTMGAGIGKDGKPFGSVDSNSEAVAASSDKKKKKKKGLPMMSSDDCAREIITATANRQPLLITPGWYRPIYFLRKFFPNLIDRLVSKMS